MVSKLVVYGFPSRYGGAGNELLHQITVWLKLGIQLHIIPANTRYRGDKLKDKLLAQGITIEAENDISCIEPGDPVIGFCDDGFLDNIERIHTRSENTIYVNCMTWLFKREKRAMRDGRIRMFLYQNDSVRQQNMPVLRALNSNPRVRFHTFKPYFDAHQFPWVPERDPESTGVGRISRQDPDKFSAWTLHIYEYMVSPKPKAGLFLGFDKRSEAKIGKPPAWIRTAHDHRSVSQQEFYRHCGIVLQPMDTTENWPRVGFEAMSSGSVLVVDKRGGWQQMIEHGKTGWLCSNPREFIYYASKMAFEPELRDRIAAAARERCRELCSLESSLASWQEVFAELDS